MVSTCSTRQSPRAANAFSRACAARTCPAPEDAESKRTRGLRLMRAGRRSENSRRLPGTGNELFENGAAEFLQFAEAREVILKFLIQQLSVRNAELMAKNDVTQFDRVRKKRIFLQFFESGSSVVVVHEDSCVAGSQAIVLVCGIARKRRFIAKEKRQDQAAVCMNS